MSGMEPLLRKALTNLTRLTRVRSNVGITTLREER